MGLKPRTSALIEAVLREGDLQRRVQKTARFFALKLHPKDVGPKYEEVVVRCLQDSLETGNFDQALICLERQQRTFNIRWERRFSDLAVTVFLRAKRKQDALNWVAGVADISGASAVEHIRTGSEFNALHSYKKFQRIFHPDAQHFRLQEELKESIDMWKNDEYDNFKDAIEDSQSLVEDAKRLKSKLLGNAQKHHRKIVKEAQKLMKHDPVAREYLDGIVPV